MISSKHVIAVVGATGAVGREALAILESRKFPASRLRVTASERSVGNLIDYAGQQIALTPSTPESVRDEFLILCQQSLHECLYRERGRPSTRSAMMDFCTRPATSPAWPIRDSLSWAVAGVSGSCSRAAPIMRM